jgi:hypothetical protein
MKLNSGLNATVGLSTWANQGSYLHTILHTMCTGFIRLDCRFYMIVQVYDTVHMAHNVQAYDTAHGT